jgi:hypothetical protein
VSPAISADLLVQSIFHDHNVNLQQAHAAPACNVHIDRHPDRTRLHPPVPSRHLLQAGHQLHRHPSGSHIQLAEVELYDPSGAKMPTGSLQLAMSSTYNWNNNPNNPRPAALCNDSSYTTLCHSENPSSGDPWPWLAATYPCPEGSTSLAQQGGGGGQQARLPGLLVHHRCILAGLLQRCRRAGRAPHQDLDCWQHPALLQHQHACANKATTPGSRPALPPPTALPPNSDQWPAPPLPATPLAPSPPPAAVLEPPPVPPAPVSLTETPPAGEVAPVSGAVKVPLIVQPMTPSVCTAINCSGVIHRTATSGATHRVGRVCWYVMHLTVSVGRLQVVARCDSSSNWIKQHLGTCMLLFNVLLCASQSTLTSWSHAHLHKTMAPHVLYACTCLAGRCSHAAR